MGHQEIVQFLLFNDPRKAEDDLKYSAAGYAAAEGRIDIVTQLLFRRNIPNSKQLDLLMLIAAEHGHTDLVRMLVTDRTIASPGFFRGAIMKAAAKGHCAVVRLLLSTGHPDIKGCLPIAIDAASKNGQFKTAALLYSAALDFAGWDINPEMSLVKAAYAGDLILVRANLLLAAGQELQTAPFYRECALIGAAEEGQLEIVRELVVGMHIPHAVRGHAIERAARNGHLEIVRALYTGSRLIPIEHALAAAAKNKHFNIVSLLATGYEVSNTALAKAALSAAAVALAALTHYFYNNNNIGPL